MKALSVRAPWWWFILHGGKDIENRDWRTNFRGKVYVHASKFFGRDVVYWDWMSAVSHVDKVPPGLTLDHLKPSCGCIVGTVEIVDCVEKSDSRWFCGDYGFVLANPVAFEKPIPFKGALGFFEVPEGTVKL